MKYDLDTLPDWLVIDQKIVAGEPITDLEKFIHANEIAGQNAAIKWRKSLCKALNEVIQRNETSGSDHQ